ncbi:MAG: hypothetical protein ABR502_08195 [Chitinophagaceae bacterium]
MKKKYVTYTSTMESKLMEDISEYAVRKKISKNKVIEEALKTFIDEQEKQELIESLKKIANDPEILEMAEWGIEDYAKQLKDYENESTGNLVRKPGAGKRKRTRR